MWRVVLTGEKLAMHMLQPDDYVAAAQNTLTSAWKTVKSLPASLRAAAVTVLVVAIVGVGLIVGVSTASPGAKIGGTLGFLVAGLVSAGRLLKSAGRQLDPIVEKIKDPLWQTEVDYVVALALTRPPAGRPDSEAWDHFVDESQLQLTGQAQAPVNSPATG